MKKCFLILLTVILIGYFGYAETNVQSTPQNVIPKYGNDSIKCITNISLYREFFKQWQKGKYKNESTVIDAISPWREVFNNCPRATQNVYIDGAKIFKHFISKEKDKINRAKLIDTLMMIYDQRIQYFGKKGYVLGRKGVDLYQLSPDNNDKAYSILKESVELQGNKSKTSVIIFYFRSTIKHVKQNNLDRGIIVETYDKISTIIDFNIKNPKLSEKYKNVQANIENEFSPFAGCEDLISIYSKKFKETPEDIELLKKISKKLDDKGCNDSELFFEVTKSLQKLEPSPETSYLMGRMLIQKEKYNEAIEYLVHATTLFEDADKKADAYYLLSNIYLKLKNYKQARTYAYKGIKNRPNDGNFYLTIGDIYASDAKSYGSNDLTRKVVYWAAVDKYIKAKKVDPSVKINADKRIKAYSAAFPSIETIFFYNLKEGETYEIGSWINEKTIVRASK